MKNTKQVTLTPQEKWLISRNFYNEIEKEIQGILIKAMVIADGSSKKVCEEEDLKNLTPKMWTSLTFAEDLYDYAYEIICEAAQKLNEYCADRANEDATI